MVLSDLPNFLESSDTETAVSKEAGDILETNRFKSFLPTLLTQEVL